MYSIAFCYTQGIAAARIARTSARPRHASLEWPERLAELSVVLSFGRGQSELLGNGPATSRYVDGTASKTRQRSRSRLDSRSVQSAHRLILVETQPPSSGVRSDNDA